MTKKQLRELRINQHVSYHALDDKGYRHELKARVLGFSKTNLRVVIALADNSVRTVSETHLSHPRSEPHKVSDPNTPEAQAASTEYWEKRSKLKPIK